MDQKQYAIYHENKAHTALEFPYNTYPCSIPLDFYSVPTHWHNEMELIVIKKGEGIVYVDLKAYDVKANDIVILLPGQLHAIEQKDDFIMEYENIFFKTDLLSSSSKDLCTSDFLQPLFQGRMTIPPVLTEYYSYHKDVTDCIAQIDILSGKRPLGYQLAIKGLLYQIFYYLVTNNTYKESCQNAKKSLDKMKTILTYIQENYSRPITVDEMANECYYSKSHFMKFFKDSMGMGFIQYLNEYRLNVACQMLRESSDSILNIAAMTGFDHLSYFNRIFKRKYGITPGEFRKLT